MIYQRRGCERRIPVVVLKDVKVESLAMQAYQGQYLYIRAGSVSSEKVLSAQLAVAAIVLQKKRIFQHGQSGIGITR